MDRTIPTLDATGSDSTGDQGPAAAGQNCTAASQCASGFCADGVCCNVACSGPCVTCNPQGNPGVCTPVLAGAPDPRATCADQGIESCGTTGKCDGQAHCALYAPGAICRGEKCLGSTRTSAATCDGQGSCQNGPSTSCGAYTCNTTTNVCKSACTAQDAQGQSADCTTGNYCINGSCGPKAAGATCGSAAECASGFCQQGVCCTTTCTGTCMSCAVEGSKGICKQVPDGSDPLGQCSDQGTASCGNDGMCDGKGKCRLYAAATECKPSSCSIDGKTLQARCDGDGACVPGVFQSCSPYVCASATDCGSSCATDGDCATPFSCQGGQCTTKGGGLACSSPSECAGGFCEGGTCCNTACPAPCKSCTTGTCTNLAANTDPNNECPTEVASSCGHTGVCDGNGACAFYASGTQCKPLGCTGSQLTPASRCDGQGTCVDKTSSSCEPFVCGTNACLTACSSDLQCASPNVCTGTACGKKPTGSTCTAADECNSGVCAQGFCCSSACTGTCMSCGVPGSEGTCSAIPAGGAAPIGQCSDNGAGSCGTDGACDGAGQCQLYPAGTLCGDLPSCSGSTQTGQGTCDGDGACTPGAPKSCEPYACVGAVCGTSCTSTAQCAASYSCVGGKCQLLATGSSCASDAQCATGICAQGTCCTGACGGCNSCSLPGTLGQCKPLPAGATPDPAGTCTSTDPSQCKTDGKCDGNGSCRNWPSGTQCGAASCVGSVLTPSAVCNGSGTCSSTSSRLCDPYVCNGSGTACLISCSSNAECTGGATCDAGNCGLLPNGAACGGNGACNSGFCVDGVCCNSACTGPCQSCTVAGNAGSCTAVTAGADPDGDCTDQGAASCGDDGTCDGSGGCRKYADGTACAAATCTDQHTLMSGRSCDGTANVCEAGTTTGCAPYACAAGACRTTCTTDADCAAGYTCNGAACMASNIIPGSSASKIGPSNSSAVTTTTFPHALAWARTENDRRIALLGITGRFDGGTPAAVTYDGKTMTLLDTQTSNRMVLVYYILDADLPATAGTYDVAVTTASQTYAALFGVQSFANVAQKAPARLKTAAAGNGTATLSVSAPAQGMVIADFVGFEMGSASAGAGQTVTVTPGNVQANGYHLGGSYKACNGADPCSSSWTLSGGNGAGYMIVQLTP